jgi:phosphoenolpyruvate carboxykinase (ATP)
LYTAVSRPLYVQYAHPPHLEELENFGEPDYVVFNAGQFPANRHTTGMTSKTSVDLSFEQQEIVIWAPNMPVK